MSDIGAVLVMLSNIRETTTRGTSRAQGVVADIILSTTLTSQALGLTQGYGREIGEMLELAAEHQKKSILCLRMASQRATQAADSLMGF